MSTKTKKNDRKEDAGRKRTALDGKRLNAFAMDPDDLVIIGLDTDDGPEHPLYDERVKLPLDEMLTRNIMVNGVIQDVIVTKDGERVLVVAGRQRVRSTREANKRLTKEGKQSIHVPVKPRRGDDKSLFGVFVSENEQRRGDSPLTKAIKVQRLLDLGASEEEVAIQFGVSEQMVEYYKKLLELSPKVKDSVDDGRLTASAAMQLHGLSRAEQDTKLKELLQHAAQTGERITARISRGAAGKVGGATAPGKRKLAKLSETLPMPLCALISWALGEMDEKTLLREVPSLVDPFAKAFAPKQKKLAAPVEDEDEGEGDLADGTSDGEEDAAPPKKRVNVLKERAKKLGVASDAEGDA